MSRVYVVTERRCDRDGGGNSVCRWLRMLSWLGCGRHADVLHMREPLVGENARYHDCVSVKPGCDAVLS